MIAKVFARTLCLMAAVAIATSLRVSAATLPADSVSVAAELARLEQTYGGRLGLAALDLATGASVRFHADEKYPTASVIKLPVMAAYFHLVETHQIDPRADITLADADKKPGSGVLQFLSGGDRITLADAVKLMIILSDNTATNLVIDRLAPTHEARLEAVNSRMAALGLKNTRLLNRLYSWGTKQTTPESIRYGIGVSTPDDMVTLMKAIYHSQAADSASCLAMIDILKDQSDRDMIPRFLPSQECRFLDVAHKTGSINEVKSDVALVLSDRTRFALAIFVDKSADHGADSENRAILLGARAARVIWNYFTGSTGESRTVNTRDVDWTHFPGGKWAIYRTGSAPFPHPERLQGLKKNDGTVYPYFPHYADSSVIVFVPDGFRPAADGANVIVHFHGHLNDNLGVLERYRMPQAMIAAKTNALLVIPQGPYRARDSFGGKMEDDGGFKRLVEDVMTTMKSEKIVSDTQVRQIIISAHSGGYRPAGFSVEKGGAAKTITRLFLFDAFYGQHDYFGHWLESTGGEIYAAYTEHLAGEHKEFLAKWTGAFGSKLHFTTAGVEHEEVVQAFLQPWLESLDTTWKLPKP